MTCANVAICSILLAGIVGEPIVGSSCHIDEQAVAANATTFLGCDSSTTPSGEASKRAVESTTLVDSTTPFLLLDNRPAYKVSLSDVAVSIERRVGDAVKKIEAQRTFDVYADTANGDILQIVSVLPSYYENVAKGKIRMPTKAEAERQMAASHEEYVSTSSAPPHASLLQIPNVLPSNPLKADLITAVCVDYSRGGDTLPVWVVDTYGVESISTGHNRMEEYQLNHIRSVVDANTGKLLSWSNRPYVESPMRDSDEERSSGYPVVVPRPQTEEDSTHH